MGNWRSQGGDKLQKGGGEDKLHLSLKITSALHYHTKVINIDKKLRVTSKFKISSKKLKIASKTVYQKEKNTVL